MCYNRNMFSRHIQERVRRLVMRTVQPLARLGVTPNTLTVLGLLLSTLAALVIAQGALLAGGFLVFFAGIFDMFDGAIARVSNTGTTFGAFFDSTLDRYSESIILLGLLLYALHRPDLHDALWPFPNEQLWMVTLIYIAIVGSLMVSYAKARAEGLGLTCKTGILARPERVVILTIGLLSGTTIWALLLLAVFSHVTTFERIAYIWRVTRQPGGGANSCSPNTPPAGQESRLDLDSKHATIGVGKSEARDATALPVHTSVPPFTGGVHQD